MTWTLRAFLETRSLNGVTFGMTMSDVRTILGTPRAEGPLDDRYYLSKYGAAEVTFYDGLVCALGLYLGRRPDLPKTLRLRGYKPGATTTVDELVDYALREGLACAEYTKLTRPKDEITMLVMGAGVTAWFYGTSRRFDHFYDSGGEYPSERLRSLV
jgi:hypothetical protein